ncbi:MAG: hypothetical protein Q7T82_14990 [Armatimonadota bacterium]|nr:hypothetical protein [Armatimonadota bacterium]
MSTILHSEKADSSSFLLGMTVFEHSLFEAEAHKIPETLVWRAEYKSYILYFFGGSGSSGCGNCGKPAIAGWVTLRKKCGESHVWKVRAGGKQTNYHISCTGLSGEEEST